MATPAENPIILDLQDSYGSLLIGCFLSTIVWGISCMQTFLYFLTYDDDPRFLKSVVVFLWAVDTANEILLLMSLWPVLILQWGRVAGLSITQPTLLHHGWVAGIVAVGVQFFFLYRIYIFSGKKWLFPAILAFMATWQIIGTIPYDVLVTRPGTTLAVIGEPKMMAFSLSLRGVSATVDILIALAMVYLLVKNGETGFSTSKQLIFRLIISTINSGIWTAVIALLDLCLMAAFPTGLQFCVFEFPLSSLYVNSLLANLNARKYLKGRDTEWHGSTGLQAASGSTSGSIALGSMHFKHRSRGGAEFPSRQDESVTIRVSTMGDEDFAGDSPKNLSPI